MSNCEQTLFIIKDAYMDPGLDQEDRGPWAQILGGPPHPTGMGRMALEVIDREAHFMREATKWRHNFPIP